MASSRKPTTYFLAGLMLALATGGLSSLRADETQALESGFDRPGLETAPWVFWRWQWGNAELIDNENITAELEAMKAQGIGGVNIDTVGSIAPGKNPAAYMSKPWLDLIAHARRESSRLGLGFFIDDCDGWATTGGPWITPETSMKDLTFSSVQVTGPQDFHQMLAMPPSKLSFYRDVATLAFDPGHASPDKVINLSSAMDASGNLVWKVPAGAWTILRVGYTTTGATNHPASAAGLGLECDKLGADGIDAEVKGITPLIQVLTTNGTGKPFIGMDSWECGAQNWTETLPAAFKERYGYDLIPWLPVLLQQAHAPNEGPVIEDFSRIRQDMTAQNYMSHFCDAGKRLGFEVESESTPEFADIPKGEFWAVSRAEAKYGPQPTFFKDDPLRVIGVEENVPSTGRGSGKNIIAVETLTSRSQNWERTPSALKADVDWALCFGYNKIVFHVYAFQPDAKVKPTYCEHGTGVNRNLTWWNEAHAWFAYISRCQFLLRQGVHVSDVCFIERNEHEWIDKVLQEDFPAKYRYDICRWPDVLSRMSVRDGEIVTPEGETYRLLVLPPGDRIPLEGMRKIHALVENGATLLGQPVTRAEGFGGYPQATSEVQALAQELWGKTPAPLGQRSVGKGHVFWGMTVEDSLAALNCEPDFRVDLAEGAGVDWVHRRSGGTDIYFVVNRAATSVTFNAFFRVKDKAPELWDADSGERLHTLLYEGLGDETRVPLHLNPYESKFVVFRAPMSLHYTSVDSGTNPSVAAADLVLSPQGALLTADQAGNYQLGASKGQKVAVPIAAVPEPVALTGPWLVRFLDGQGAPTETTFLTLTPWTENADERIKYYSGAATYSCHFTMPANPARPPHWLLDLGDVRELADVKVNGQLVATLWRPPFRADITPMVKVGDNELEITVVDTWLNRFLGDLQLPPDKRICTIGLHSTESYTRDFPLPVSGLLGPVKIFSRPTAIVPLPRDN